MDIRLALPADAPALTAFAASLFRETYAGQVPPVEVEAYVSEAFHPETQAAEISHPGGAVLLALEGPELLAYAQLRPAPCPCPFQDPAPVEVARFYLAFSRQGVFD